MKVRLYEDLDSTAEFSAVEADLQVRLPLPSLRALRA